jgi:hypothetical protein
MAVKDIISTFVDGSITIDDDNSNSATLAKMAGDVAVSGLMPSGRQASVAETQGALTGVRKGARAFPSISCSGQLADFSDAFHKLAMGITAGFTSTTADIGDYPTVDLTFAADYSTDTREIVASDCRLTEFSMQQGDPTSTVNFTFEVLGPLTIDGDTYIASR